MAFINFSVAGGTSYFLRLFSSLIKVIYFVPYKVIKSNIESFSCAMQQT